MSKVSGIESEFHHGQYPEAGYDVTSYFHPRFHRIGGAAVLLKGGLGNPGSETMATTMDALLEVSKGRLLVGIVGTTRPESWPRFVLGSLHPRKHHSQSIKGASDHVNDTYHPKSLLLVGQSAGGIAAIDGALYQAKHPKKNPKSPNVGVVTIDSPGIFEPLHHNTLQSLLLGMGRLSANMMEDIRKLPRSERIKHMARSARNFISAETTYFLNEANGLKNVSVRDDIAALRGLGIAVRHIFHDEDVVPGAEWAVGRSDSLVLPGGHARFMVEPEPVAAYIYDFANDLLAQRHGGQQGTVIQFPQRGA